MSSILNLSPASVETIRQATAVVEVVRFEFNGGTTPMFNIALTTPLVGDAYYTFTGNVEGITSGGINGICYGGGAGETIDEAGPFEQVIQAEPGADGNSIFQIRGQTGTVATLSGVSLVPN